MDQLTELLKLAEAQGIAVSNEKISEFSTPVQDLPVTNCLFFENMENGEYHAGSTEVFGRPTKKYLSASTLKMATTPLHLQRYFNQNREFNMAFAVGTAAHTIIAEPELFNYVMFDDRLIVAELKAEGSKSPRSTKRYKEFMSEYCDENGDLREDVLPVDLYNSLVVMKNKLNKNEVVKNLLRASMAENSFFMSFEGGMYIKVRPDLLKFADATDAENFKEYDLKEGDLMLISIKTTLDASPDGYPYQARKLKYHLAEALYVDILTRFAQETGLFDANQNKVVPMYLVVEKDSSNQMTGAFMVRMMSDEYIKWGRRAYAKNLEVYTNCMKSKDFSGGYETINGGSVIAPM